MCLLVTVLVILCRLPESMGEKEKKNRWMSEKKEKEEDEDKKLNDSAEMQEIKKNINNSNNDDLYTMAHSNLFRVSTKFFR